MKLSMSLFVCPRIHQHNATQPTTPAHYFYSLYFRTEGEHAFPLMHPRPLCAHSHALSLSHSLTVREEKKKTRQKLLVAACCRVGGKKGKKNYLTCKNCCRWPQDVSRQISAGLNWLTTLGCVCATLASPWLLPSPSAPFAYLLFRFLPTQASQTRPNPPCLLTWNEWEAQHTRVYLCVRACTHVEACVWALHCLPPVRISRWGAGGGTGEAWRANIDSASDAHIYLLKGRVLWLMTGPFLIFLTRPSLHGWLA